MNSDDNLKNKSNDNIQEKSNNNNNDLQGKIDDLELENFKLRKEVHDLSIKIEELVF